MDLLWALLQIFAMLGAVVALIYLVLNKGLGRFMASRQVSTNMSVTERLFLDPRRSLYLIQIKGRDFVLAGSENGVSLVCELHEKP